jgi:hypothetical protein
MASALAILAVAVAVKLWLSYAAGWLCSGLSVAGSIGSELENGILHENISENDRMALISSGWQLMAAQ